MARKLSEKELRCRRARERIDQYSSHPAQQSFHLLQVLPQWAVIQQSDIDEFKLPDPLRSGAFAISSSKHQTCVERYCRAADMQAAVG